MHIYKTFFGGFILTATTIFSSPSHAQDLLKLITNRNPSVEVYSFDEATPYIEYAPARQYTPPPAPAAITEETTKAKPEPIETGWLGANWEGRVNFGASLQTGNTEQDTINADATVKAKWPGDDGYTKHRATVKAEYNVENEDDVRTEDNRSIEGIYDYFFNKKWFLNSHAKAEQDDISNVDIRANGGIGIGYQMFERDDLNLQMTLGPTYLYEEFEDGSDDSSAAGRWTFDYDQKVLEEKLQLFHEHEFLVPFDDSEGFLFDSKSGVRLPIVYGVVGTAEVEFDWDNQPEPGIKEDDTTYSLKLGYEW